MNLEKIGVFATSSFPTHELCYLLNGEISKVSNILISTVGALTLVFTFRVRVIALT